MCLGTTRHDAGSAANFIRCDYDYVIAFIEAVITFSGPAGFALPSDISNSNNNNKRNENNATSAENSCTGNEGEIAKKDVNNTNNKNENNKTDKQKN